MTNFGLSGGYKVHDGLDQSEIFSPLLWRIFYDPLLCEVKRHEQLYGEKMVAIPINQGFKIALLSICGQPILIAKKGELHRYLSIFLSTERLSKPSVAKAHTDICFFVNVVLRKTIIDKQFSYLVSAVLQSIVSYCMQFSFISPSVCRKDKDLVVSWIKVKGHFGVSCNERTNLAAQAASESFFLLLADMCKHFLVAKEAGPGYDVISDALIGCVNWVVMAKMWYPDSYMFAGFISHKSLTLCTYLIKAVHRKLPVIVKKRLYNKCYPGVLCLLCGSVEFPDHAFTCVCESSIHDEILAETSAHWSALAGVFNVFSSAMLQVLSQCSVNIGLYTLVYKEFVLNDWC
ncbi:hypothetical protein G9A89_015098 [Geosiphon pyriformis]|nr:hypothetical protein G9A89_015098 [Geosiphon pyriformis]